MLKKKRNLYVVSPLFDYSNKLILCYPILEPTVSTFTPHVVKTTGTGILQNGIIPIASLFSSMDFVQPSTTIKKSPLSYTPLRRAKTSLYQIEPENEPKIM